MSTTLLIRNATIVDPNSRHNGKERDVLIRNGIIETIKAKITGVKGKEVDVKGACLSPGWLDVGIQSGDPGFEHREDLESVARAAAAGGYTGVVCQPNTMPVTHSKTEVLYLKNRTKENLVNFYPLGAVSQNCEGSDITEMNDMHQAGAVAFTDGEKSIQDSGLMKRALQYVKSFDGLIMNYPQDRNLAHKGQMHEGVISTTLGMKGIPALAEELMTGRDISLAEYTDSNLHLSSISTSGSISLIKEARSNGVNVTASVAALNLTLDDENLLGFDSNYKVLPPLREKNDIKALLKGLKNGHIDFITSNHSPHDEESKKLEFPLADFGVIGLETTYALLNTHLGKQCSQEEFVNWLSINARKILRLAVPTIEAGEKANLTIFDPNKEWTYSKDQIQSKSHNSPFIGTTFKGKVLGIVNNGQALLTSV